MGLLALILVFGMGPYYLLIYFFDSSVADFVLWPLAAAIDVFQTVAAAVAFLLLGGAVAKDVMPPSDEKILSIFD